MADLWPGLEHHFDGHLAAVHEVTTIEVAALDEQLDAAAGVRGGHRPRRRPRARRREVLRLAPRPAAVPGPDIDDDECRVRPSCGVASRGPRSRSGVGRPGGGLRRLRRDPERAAAAQPERRRRRALPSHRPCRLEACPRRGPGGSPMAVRRATRRRGAASSSTRSSPASTRSTTSRTPASALLMSAHRWGGAAFHDAGWNARHLDGVDHAFLYCLEHQTGRSFIHGQAVGLGTYLGAVLQDNQPEVVLGWLHRAGVDIRPEAMGIDWEAAAHGDAAARLVRPPRGPALHDRRCPAGDRRRRRRHP